ncbi:MULTISPECIES: metallophosphoesterase [unclassified Pannonibacter]|uniref:metallophosphoesterase n=1 Tax=unclassified Pannonibacter TaxID=2627228 RepID=UPI00164470B2|nr:MULTISPECIES: metallophosphoesterase [unclassified Pannonibacter]
MSRLRILSDLHQEFVREPRYGKHPLTKFDPDAEMDSDFDVLAIVGDLDVPLTRSLEWIADRFPGETVLYVPGNHDFYSNPAKHETGFTMLEQIDAGMELADKLGIHLLHDSVLELPDDGVRFIGATLWTDMATVGFGTKHSKMAQAEGKNGMNDFKNIKRESTTTPGKRKRIRAQHIADAHAVSRSFIESALAKPFDGETVVLTHHAPHPESLWAEPDLIDLAWCYASNLTSILESETAPDLWCHGHIHDSRDYHIANSRTRVVSNSRGYAFAEDPAKRTAVFDPNFTVEVGYRPGMKP